MIPYSCAQCATQWQPGFFGNQDCPRCSAALGGLRVRVVRFVRNWILIFLAVFAVIAFASIDRLVSPRHTARQNAEQLELFAQRFFSFPNFFLIGPEGYLRSLSDAGVLSGVYAFRQPMPAFRKPVMDAEATAQGPAMMIPAERPFRLIEVRRFGEREWLGGSNYRDDKPNEFWVPLQDQWQSSIDTFDMATAIAGQRANFRSELNRRFVLQTVREGDEAVEYARRHPDQLSLRVAPEDHFFLFYPASQKSKVRALQDYYLSNTSLDMVVLQMNPNFQRQAFGADDPADAGRKHGG
jgi:hypothetical protein